MARVHGHLRRRVRPRASRWRALSFFVEAIFIAIYVYGWDRLSPRAAHARRDPGRDRRLQRFAHGDRVNGWMNHPTGFRLRGRADGRRRADQRLCSATRTSGTSSFTCTWRPSSSPASSPRASMPWPGCADATTAMSGRRWRCRWTVAAIAAPAQVIVGDWAARTVAENQPTKLAAFEGLGRTEKGAPLHIGGWYDEERARCATAWRSRSCCHCSRSTTRTRPCTGLDERPGRRPPAGERGAHRVLDDGRDRHVDGAASERCCWSSGGVAGALPEGRWFHRRWSPRSARCRSRR